MNSLGLCLAVQLSLGFGVASLLWPEKFLPLCEVLMFPWAPNSRILRANSVAAILLSLILFAALLAHTH